MSTTTTTTQVKEIHCVEMESNVSSQGSTLKSASLHGLEQEAEVEKVTPPKPLWIRVRQTAWQLFVKYWFLLGLAFVIGLAWAIPTVGKSYGSIQAQYTVKWGAVIVIFLLSGLGLDVKVMLRTILRWRLHLYVQVINFLILPFLAWGIVRFFIIVGAHIDEMVYQGWIIALSTSTTVSSNSVMTRNANGNDGAAVFNAALGNVLGIFISPALMTIFGDDRILFPPGSARGKPDYIKVLFQLGLTVLVPLVVGQVIRFLFPKQIKYLSAKLKFPIINSIALLIMVWSVFCDGVASDAFHQLSGVDIVAIIGVDIFLYLFGCALCLFVCRLPWPQRYGEPTWLDRYRLSRKDAAAVMYCGATKTVSMGIPLINVLYSGTSAGVVGVLSLPLLMYHICQLFIGNFQVSLLKKWIQKGEDEDSRTVHEQQSQVNETQSLPSFTTRRRTVSDE
ncbi:SBF-like CPA transporter family-domain-containing protein [Halteromyces radiatus]|uniref:SBF-like CPA transporter family-domain-containing protein n=1 Tax=Halteromyces radiatus TaxID=101107 RepID=UPI00222059CE|nr:SBF-like CPA transporter family-domain-containing protein [Halteromyces radiatus]KAI8078855.1 SBF-like CPA transporter family-domain-containing protein [Halteromyces radiatus]